MGFVDITGARGRRGFTLLELMIAGFLGLLVVLALGRIILASQRSWEWGRDKVALQANTTEALEAIARSVRAARTLEFDGADPDHCILRTYDELGLLVHTYTRIGNGATARLQEDGSDYSTRECVHFLVIPNRDTSSVHLNVSLRNMDGFEVAAETDGAVRNIHYVWF